METLRFLALAAGIGLACLITFQAAESSGPQGASPARVAVCDTTDLFNRYDKARDLSARDDERQQAIKGEDQKRVQAVRDAELILESLHPGSDAHENQTNEVLRLKSERQAWAQAQDHALKREHSRLTREMYAEMLAAIAAMAESKGFAIVVKKDARVQADGPELLREIDRQVVLHWDASVDITEVVLGHLNMMYKRRQSGGKR